MPSKYGFFDRDDESGRSKLIRKTYEEYANPQTGQVEDEEGFQKAIVQNMYKYGDTEGIREFTRMQSDRAALARGGRKQKEDPLDVVYPAAEGINQMYQEFKKRYKDEAKAREAVAPYYRREAARFKAQGIEVEPEFNPDSINYVVQQGRAKHGKFWKDEKTDKPEKEKTLGPGEKARMELHNREVDAYQADLDAWLAKGKKKEQFDFQYPDKAKVLGKGKYSLAGSMGGAAPAAGAKTLDRATAAGLLKEAGGDKARARQLAKDRGYKF